MPERGMMRRGKYPLVMILAFTIMLFVERVSPSANRVQGSKAARTKSG
jgi:hypothetical protein